MTPCDWREAYLDGDLDEAARAHFERHLDGCPQCKANVAHWAAIREQIVAQVAAEDEQLAGWEPAQRRRLEQRAGGGGQPRPPSGRLVWVAAAVLMLAGLGLFLLARELHDPTQDPRPTMAEHAPGPLSIEIERIDPDGTRQPAPAGSTGSTIEAPPDGRLVLTIGEDKVTLIEGSGITIVEACTARLLLDLQHGTVICDVKPRSAGQRFRVMAGQQTVTVTGTRFAVTRRGDDLDVAVIEGMVRFEGPDRAPVDIAADHSARAVAGVVESGDLIETQRALFGTWPPGPAPDPVALQHSEPAPALAPATSDAPLDHASIEDWQLAIIDGDRARTAAEIEDHLATAPGDHQAWSLLADCRRKQGDWEGAVHAYEQVITHAPGPEANTARFRAGTLHQDRLDRHEQATILFNAYLEHGDNDPLAAEALLRLARSHRELGHDAQTRQALQRAVDQHAGTQAAAEARRLLAEMSAGTAQ